MNSTPNSNQNDYSFLSHKCPQNIALKTMNNVMGKMLVTLAAISEAVVWVNRERTIQWCNLAFQELVEKSEEEILGVKFRKILPLSINGQSINLKSYPDVKIQQGEYQTREYEFSRANNSLVLEISGDRAAEDNGSNSSILIIKQNTHQQKPTTPISIQVRELKYRHILENSQVGIGRFRQIDGLILDANQRCAEILGYTSAAELISQKYIHEFELIKSDYAETLQELVQKGEIADCEVQLKRKDGSLIWGLLWRCLNVEEDCIEFVIADISERKQKEKALNLLLEGTATQVGQDFFCSCTRSLAKLLQVRYAFIAEFANQAKDKARTLACWWGEDFKDNCEYELVATPSAEVLKGARCRYAHSLQKLFPQDPYLKELAAESFIGLPITNPQGEVMGLLAVIDDKPLNNANFEAQWSIISIFAARAGAELERQYAENALAQLLAQEKQQRQALEEAKHNAEVASRAKSQFLANMSHELRTPLNAILGFTQLMSKDETITPKQQKSLSIINKSGERLLRLINDVLEMSKIETGQTKLQPKVFNLHRMLHDLKAMFQPLAQAKQLSLQFESARGLIEYINTDEIKLRQVLINLLDNAIKFTQTGSVTLRVLSLREIPIANASITSNKAKLIFEIEDTGIGIAGTEMKLLFQPFAQTATDIASQTGTGLGLAISQHFASLMGGKINLVSTLGEGSKFSFGIQVDIAPSSTEKNKKCSKSEYSGFKYVSSHESGFKPVHAKRVECKSLKCQDLCCMNSQWIARLYHAAIAVDADLIKELIAEIPPTHQAVAKALEELMRNYDFDRIVELSSEDS